MIDMVRTQISLTYEQIAWLRVQRERTGESMSSCIRRLLMDAIQLEMVRDRLRSRVAK